MLSRFRGVTARAMDFWRDSTVCNGQGSLMSSDVVASFEVKSGYIAHAIVVELEN